MNTKNTDRSRRRFIKTGLASAVALQVGVVANRAFAAELPHLDEADPSAKALGYVHDASTVAEQVRGGADRACSNCRFYAKDNQGWGPCTLFPGKAVAAPGWCKGWVAKA